MKKLYFLHRLIRSKVGIGAPRKFLLKPAWFFLLFTMLIFVQQNTYAQENTGLLSPAANVTGNVTNPDSAYVSDNMRALFDANNDVVSYHTFGISIPAGSVIQGIMVNVEGYETGTKDLDVQLSWNSGTSVTAIKTAVLGNTESVVSVGGDTVRWGRTWSVSEFADGVFRVRLTANGGGSQRYVDHVQVIVYYCEPPEITAQPVDASVIYGKDTLFAVTATGSSLSYQWQVNAGSGYTDITDGGVYSGADNDTLTLTKPGVAMSGYAYRCVITANCGSEATSSAVSLAVSARELTVTGATAENKTYDGLTTAKIAGAELVNVVTGDDVALNDTTGTFSQANVGEDIPVTAALTLKGAAAGNYSLTQPTGLTADITTADLTVTAKDTTKTYGTLLENLSGSDWFTTSGLQNAETIGTVTLAFGDGAAAADTVGIYADQVTPSNATGGTFTATNYSITYAKGDIIVQKAALTITAKDTTKMYGTALAGLAGSKWFTTTGLKNSETVGSVSLAFGTGSQTGDPVGTYTDQVTPSAATGGTFSTKNYDITYVPGDIIVEAAPLTIAAKDTTKTYGTQLDGLSGSTWFTATGLQNSETVGTVTLAFGDGAAADDTVGVYADQVTPSAATGGTFTASNYDITYATADIIVEALEITVTADRKTKNCGYPDPELTYTWDPALVGTDAFTGSLTRVVGEDLGKYKILQGTLALPDDYILTYVADSLIITLDLVCPNDTSVLSNAADCMAKIMDIGYATVSGNCTPVGTALITYMGLPADSLFPMGPTVVTWSVTDDAGNTNQCTQTINVMGAICPNDTVIILEEGECSIQANTIDLTEPIPSEECFDGSGTFKISNDFNGQIRTGISLVTWEIKRAGGGTDVAYCYQNVWVKDTIDPVIVCATPAASYNVDNGTCTYTVPGDGLDPTASDDCTDLDDLVFVNDFNGLATLEGAEFPLDTTLVTWVVKDASGNTDTCEISIVVKDNIDPVIGASNIDAGTSDDDTDNCEAVIDVDPMVTDNCDPSPEVEWTMDLPGTDTDSGTGAIEDYAFPLGATIITFTVTDASGNDATKDITVTVTDDQDPDLTPAAAINAGTSDDDTGDCEVSVDVPDAVYSDDCSDVTLTWEMDLPGTATDDGNGQVGTYTFPAGVTVITYTATDESSNSVEKTLTVTVTDDEKPVITCPPTIDQLADADVCYATITNLGTLIKSDNCSLSGNLLVENDAPANNRYPVGETIVTWTVTDEADNVQTCQQKVKVKSSLGPLVYCRPLTVYLYDMGMYILTEDDMKYMSETDGMGNYTGDRCAPYEDMTINVFPKTFSCSNVGDHVPVTITVTSPNGQSGQCQTTVLVLDTIPADIECEDIDVYLDANGKARIYPGLVADVLENACGVASLELSQYTFDCGDIGTMDITAYAYDNSDNVSTCVSEVTVLDTFPPVVSAVADIDSLVAPGVCEIDIEYPVLSISDNCNTTTEQIAGLGPDAMFPLGTTTETWKVTDDGGNEIIVSFDVTVTTTNAPPTLNPVNSVTVNEGTFSIGVPLTGISAGNDCAAQTVTVTAVNSNNTLVTSFAVDYTQGNATGSVDLMFAPELNGTSTVIVTVEDSQGAMVKDTFTVTVTPVNDPPVLVKPIADQLVNASYVLKVPVNQAMFEDIDDAVLTISVMKQGGGVLPAWAVVTGDTLVCTPMIADTGCVDIVVKATDAAGAFATDTFKVCVEGYPVNIGEIGKAVFEVSMYPNPTRGEVNIQINSSEVYDVDLSVTDITGKTVLRKQFSAADRIIFDMSDRVPGMYFVKLSMEGKHLVKKLIVNK